MVIRYLAIADLPAREVRERSPGAPPPPRLPALERLIARGEVRRASADWRRWALERAGLKASPGDLPLGRLVAAATGLDGAAGGSWLIASPLKLGAGLSSVRVEAAPVELAPKAASALAQHFSAEWDGSCELIARGALLVLRERAALGVTTVDPALLPGADLAAYLPRGRDAPALIRRMTEIQMWLHGLEPALGAGTFNGLWLWGAGQAALEGAPAWPTLASGDPYLAAARAVHPGREAVPPAELAQVSLLTDPSGFAAADARWFAPLEESLKSGGTTRAELHFSGHSIGLTGRLARRWWRRARPWWEFGP